MPDMNQNKEYVYVLRACPDDMITFNNFKWPKKGYVEAPDWEPTKECGNGLHGFLGGIGNVSFMNPRIFSDFNKWWLIVKVEKHNIIEFNGKVKFSKGNVILCTKDFDKAKTFLIDKGYDLEKIISPDKSAWYRNISDVHDLYNIHRFIL